MGRWFESNTAHQVLEIAFKDHSLNLNLIRPHRLAGPGHCPFTAETGVRIPLGTPAYAKASAGTASLFKDCTLKTHKL